MTVLRFGVEEFELVGFQIISSKYQIFEYIFQLPEVLKYIFLHLCRVLPWGLKIKMIFSEMCV